MESWLNMQTYQIQKEIQGLFIYIFHMSGHSFINILLQTCIPPKLGSNQVGDIKHGTIMSHASQVKFVGSL
jgi:hypothetical protein